MATDDLIDLYVLIIYTHHDRRHLKNRLMSGHQLKNNPIFCVY